ncbi:MAG: thiamine-phosphate synthase family protein [Candidatus Odinarchaeia archaeon]
MGRIEDEILGNLVRAVELLEKTPEFSALIPEVRVNIVYAKPNAGNVKDVAAVDGRITVVNERPKACGLPKFGASDHMARAILEIKKYRPEINAGINFKYTPQLAELIKEYAAEKGFEFGFIDRTAEPEEVLKEDGKSMPWKIRFLVDRYGKVPKIFYESAGWGKEPLFVIVGKTAVEVAEIAVEIAKKWKK